MSDSDYQRFDTGNHEDSDAEATELIAAGQLSVQLRQRLRILVGFQLVCSALYMTGCLSCWIISFRDHEFDPEFERLHGPCARSGLGFWIALLCVLTALYGAAIIMTRQFAAIRWTPLLYFLLTTACAVILSIYCIPTAISADPLSRDTARTNHLQDRNTTATNSGSTNYEHIHEDLLTEVIITFLLLLVGLCTALCYAAASMLFINKWRLTCRLARAVLCPSGEQKAQELQPRATEHSNSHILT